MSARRALRRSPAVAWFFDLLPQAQTGLIGGVLAFVVPIGVTSRLALNGLTIRCAYFSFSALAGVGVCFWTAGWTFYASRKEWNRDHQRLFTIVAVVLVVLGVANALRTFGTVLSPC
jgi:hypothetical protein